uniref:Uncharacterized protein n=1 Tax=Medicago truncatula TaxID=3880 RepID=Q2HVS2_MEDTR|nr:hypothetical protein MtrDRAFT_AC148762g14v2 [Medicago truncatula]ABN08918.1 hypothetical protein MtrDRAFT_AC166313g15v2 [Medicago truncatula]
MRSIIKHMFERPSKLRHEGRQETMNVSAHADRQARCPLLEGDMAVGVGMGRRSCPRRVRPR